MVKTPQKAEIIHNLKKLTILCGFCFLFSNCSPIATQYQQSSGLAGADWRKPHGPQPLTCTTVYLAKDVVSVLSIQSLAADRFVVKSINRKKEPLFHEIDLQNGVWMLRDVTVNTELSSLFFLEGGGRDSADTTLVYLGDRGESDRSWVLQRREKAVELAFLKNHHVYKLINLDDNEFIIISQQEKELSNTKIISLVSKEGHLKYSFNTEALDESSALKIGDSLYFAGTSSTTSEEGKTKVRMELWSIDGRLIENQRPASAPKSALLIETQDSVAKVGIHLSKQAGQPFLENALIIEGNEKQLKIIRFDKNFQRTESDTNLPSTNFGELIKIQGANDVGAIDWGVSAWLEEQTSVLVFDGKAQKPSGDKKNSSVTDIKFLGSLEGPRHILHLGENGALLTWQRSKNDKGIETCSPVK